MPASIAAPWRRCFAPSPWKGEGGDGGGSLWVEPPDCAIAGLRYANPTFDFGSGVIS